MTVTREHVTTSLRFGILGPMTASRGSESINLGGHRQRSVVAALLLARGQVLSTERLIDALWGERASTRAVAGLQSYVSHLRRELEPDRPARAPGSLLVSQGNGYVLRVPDDAVDAWRFESLLQASAGAVDPQVRVTTLREAMQLWHGPALVEYADQEWATPSAARLTELRNVAREQLLGARLDCGETAIVVPEIESLLAEDELREERWRLLALALYRSHRQAEALGALRRARALLAEQLGVDPGPALRALEAEVLSQSSTLDLPPVAPAGEVHPPAPAELVPAQRAGGTAKDEHTMVDREPEVALLEACLRDALAGHAGVAVVSGPAGIGKSRLLAELRHLADEAGATVLHARGSTHERGFGFGLVRQLFEGAVAGDAARVSLLTGSARGVAAVFDSLDAREEARPEGLFGALHSLYWLTVNLGANGPLVLAVDDLHWADTGSLRYLTYLTRRMEGMRLLLVATVRTDEQAEDDGLLTEITSDSMTTPVRPGPLSPAGVRELVHACLGPGVEDPFVNACYRTTGGNPLLVRQLLRALEAEHVRPDTAHADTVRAIGSRAVSSLVLMRFTRMPDDNRAVARAVAVLGQGATLPLVASLAQLPEDRAAAAIAALARAEVLRPEPPLTFVHPLVGSAVYDDIPPGHRDLAHEEAARVLAASGAAPEKVAAHLLQVPARGDPGVVQVLQDAARRDLDRGAAESAAAYLRRAVAEPPPESELSALLVRLGAVEEITNGASAIGHLGEAYRLLEDPVERAETAITLARTLVFGGEKGRASEVAHAAAADLPSELADHRQGLLALERFAGYLHDLDPAEYDAAHRPQVEGTGTGSRALAATLAWEDLVTSDHRDRALELARFALADGSLRRVDAGLLWVVAGIVLEMGGDDTLGFWQGALDDAHRRGALFTAMRAHLWLGWTQWARGDLPEALQTLATCAEQNQLWGANDIGQAYVDGFTVPILLDRGDLTGARRALDAARHRERFGDGRRLYGEAQAAVLLAEGRPGEALTALESVQQLMAGVDNPVWRAWRSRRAAVLAALGRRQEAVELVEDELVAARRWGTAELVGRTLRRLAEVGGGDQADLLRESAALLDARPQLLERAKTDAALGEVLLRAGGAADREEAVGRLRSALDLAGRCAAEGLRARAARALDSAGVDVPARHPARAALTTTERRIVRRAADGADEQAIAESLFLTLRTVRDTLAAVASRLGARSPDELRSLLADP